MSTITQQIFEDVGNLPLEMQEETLDFVRFLKTKLPNNKLKSKENVPNGTKLARLMEEASRKNLFTHIKDPAAWEREMRKDRPMPGRED
jgi:hypothetical protein